MLPQSSKFMSFSISELQVPKTLEKSPENELKLKIVSKILADFAVGSTTLKVRRARHLAGDR